jgi:hypothetical protein
MTSRANLHLIFAAAVLAIMRHLLVQSIAFEGISGFFGRLSAKLALKFSRSYVGKAARWNPKTRTWDNLCRH